MTGRLRHITVVTALLVLALAAAACGGSTEESTTATAPPANQDADTAEPSGGAEDTGIVLPTAKGGQVAFNDLLGTPTMLWFWAPW